MHKKTKWGVGACIILCLGLTGCGNQEQLSGVTEINSRAPLDGDLKNLYGTPPPIMQDVYDRSIPKEVYSSP